MVLIPLGVPSPTAATLHSLHYHEVNVFEIQKEKLSDSNNYLNDILHIPVSKGHNWSPQDIQEKKWKTMPKVYLGML